MWVSFSRVCWVRSVYPWLVLGAVVFWQGGDGAIGQPPTPTPASPVGKPGQLFQRSPLQVGSIGVEVTELQAALKLLGYFGGAVDGVYGETTAAAVTRFQTAAGLRPDGIVSTETWSQLFPPAPEPTATNPAPSATPTVAPAAKPTPTATTQPQPTPKPTPPPATPSKPTAASAAAEVELPILRIGMKGGAVFGLQERLRSLGFLKSAADSLFGPDTQAAVKAAQQKFSLEADGVVGAATWNALMK